VLCRVSSPLTLLSRVKVTAVPVTAITPPLTITAVTAVIAVPPYGGERDGVSESYTSLTAVIAGRRVSGRRAMILFNSLTHSCY